MTMPNIVLVGYCVMLIAGGVRYRESVLKMLFHEYPKLKGSPYFSESNLMLIAVGLTALFVVLSAVWLGVWRSRKWAMWVVLVFQGAVIVANIWLGSTDLCATGCGVVIPLYCLFRVLGAIGPKLT